VLTLLDGPLGTELIARGVSCPAPLWSAAALETAPDLVRAVHAEYADAGAVVHTANTFRTSRRAAGPAWPRLTRQAVALAREAAPTGRVAGSLAPLEDCYRPDLSPPDARDEHALLARCLADAGVDLLLCETFPHLGEALAAAQACVATGVETWVSFTAGPDADLLTPEDVARGAREVVHAGAVAVLVNCVPADRTLAFLKPLVGLGVPFGAYANAGPASIGIGWSPSADGPARYADHVEDWVALGATLIGSCCGCGPAHTRELKRRFGGR